MSKEINTIVDNLTSNEKLQRAYSLINSGDDYSFIRQGLRAISFLSKSKLQEFSSCDIWELLDNCHASANNPRSMGVIIKLAQKNGLIQSTGNYRPSRRKQANQRPVRIWRFC